MVQAMLEKIKRYTESVENGSHVCSHDTCPLCGHPSGEKGFGPCGKRPRTFLLVVDALVQKIRSLLTRWLCRSCRRCFTDYPSFAVPNKRYVRQEIEERSAHYLEGETATYRQVVRDGNTACGYAMNEDGTMDERQLVGSTVHRWLSWLGAQAKKRSMVLAMVKALAPRSTIHRDALPIPARKYRSEKRKETLQTARRLLHAEALVRAIRRGRSDASDFATAEVKN
jgi:hypothetical protein